jgi:hypothetical protein
MTTAVRTDPKTGLKLFDARAADYSISTLVTVKARNNPDALVAVTAVAVTGSD